MTFRLKAFSEANMNSPAIYLDTDMLVLRPIYPHELVGSARAALCRREFHCDQEFNTSFGGLDLSEYSGMTLEEVYPYIACATVTKSHEFWNECKIILSKLDAKFHKWYGDQEAIKRAQQNNATHYLELPESRYACLPDFPEKAREASILHFKGQSRKAAMLTWAKHLGLVEP